MSVVTAVVTTGGGVRHGYFEAVEPVAQASVNASTLVAGSTMDSGPWQSVAYTIVIATQSVDWIVYGANAADYSDKVAVQASATVLAGAASSYAVAQAPFRYYAVWIASTAPGVPGTATVRGCMKP